MVNLDALDIDVFLSFKGFVKTEPFIDKFEALNFEYFRTRTQPLISDRILIAVSENKVQVLSYIHDRFGDRVFPNLNYLTTEVLQYIMELMPQNMLA